MKTITNIFNVYEFSELSDDAKERAKRWYLDDDMRAAFFHDDIIEDLKNLFPHSDLKVCFSLASCQGDGLNVYGTINFNDFLEIDEKTNSDVFNLYTKKEIERLKFYFRYFNSYTFERNTRYCYSCKFIDKKYEDETIAEFTDELENSGIKKIDYYLIDRFFCDLLEWFEEYDKKMELAGYEYLYECTDEEMEDACSANEWTFLESGEFYG